MLRSRLPAPTKTTIVSASVTDEPDLSVFKGPEPTYTVFGTLSISGGSEAVWSVEGREMFSQDPDIGSLVLVTAIEDLIEVVGNNEAHLFVSLTESGYQRLVAALDGLIDLVRENEDHILASLMDFVGELIKSYEDRHIPELTEI